MVKERSQRRLAAILAADVVGYSRLMGLDENGTLSTFKAHRRELVDVKIAQHQGRIVKQTGDGLLVEFPSVLNAVTCAAEIQRKMHERNAEVPTDRRIEFRIGINLGDIIIEDDDIFGDGVNIAARIESIARPGGVAVSGSVRDSLGNRFALTFEDTGEQTLKNITRPVRVYNVELFPDAKHAQLVGLESVPDGKPSIAVLPFNNMSGDPGQDYLADGLTENVITGLSRFRDMFVIASNSSFAYKGKAIKIQDASRELGVRYILEGSMQRSSQRVRITAQLIDGNTGLHLWAERYDSDVNDIFVVQDDVTERIIGSLATGHGGRLLKAWQNRPEGGGTRNFQALDYLVRGLEALDRFTREGNSLAHELFEKAAELDPNFGKAISKIAWAHLHDVYMGLSVNIEASMAEAVKFANLAIERDDAEAWGHYALAGCHVLCERYDRAMAAYKRALELNPNDADILMDFGYFLSCAGKLAEGLETAKKAIRLNPHHPEWYTMLLGQIWFDERRYDEAIDTLTSLRTIDTVFCNIYVAASHAALGHTAEARAAVEHILQMDPQATILGRTGPKATPYKNADDLRHLRDNLLKAGLAYG